MFKWLDGYKTYLVMAALVAVALVEGALGFDVPGVKLEDNWVTLLMGAFGLGAVKSAIAKVA